MIRTATHIILIVLFATIQVSLAYFFDFLMPELVLAVILALALAGDWRHTYWWLAGGGLLLDLTVGTIPGIYLLLFSLVAATLGFLSQRVFPKPVLPAAFLVFFGFSLTLELLMAVIYGRVSIMVFVPGLLTALIASLIYKTIVQLGLQREVVKFG